MTDFKHESMIGGIMSLPQGKGLYVWQIKQMPENWAMEFKSMGITWIALKVADGTNSYNLRSLENGKWADDIIAPFVKTAKSNNMLVYGWQYVYGFNPADEADKAAQRMDKFNLDGFIIDAEGEYKGKQSAATIYARTLSKLLPENKPIGLASYRFPGAHPTFPFKQFLEYCDFNSPQVYWNKGKSAEELEHSFLQYDSINFPFIPAGRAYDGEGFPEVTASETTAFLRKAKDMNLPAVTFWSADFLFNVKNFQRLNGVREAIRAFSWKTEELPATPPIVVPMPSTNDELSGSISISTTHGDYAASVVLKRVYKYP